MTGFRILFVSAGQDSFHAVTKVLEATNHAVNYVATGKQAVSAAGSTNPSLILTDINLPDMTGYELIKAIRDDGDTAIIPIIVVSSVASEDAIVMALDIGADDYVTIPFGRRELLARIKAVHRRSTISVIESVIRVGPLTIDSDNFEAYWNGERIMLTDKEYEVLKSLAARPGRVLSRDYMLDTIWGNEFEGETRTIDVHIHHIREKLGSNSDMIETVRGVGYKLNPLSESVEVSPIS